MTGNSASDIPPQLIITVHGIRTYGQWQERLEALVRANAPERVLEFVNYKYGYFSLIAFIVPFLRWMVVRRFRQELLARCTQRPWARVDLVGHSFGTHIIAWALHKLRDNPQMSIHTVVLSGSVLRAGFPWINLIGKQIRRVINDCGSRDNVLLLSQFFVLFTGMAGRTGFGGGTSVAFRNRFSVFGHSGYFQDANGESLDRYMQELWLPLLLAEDPTVSFDKRGRPTAADDLVNLVANNAEPIKLLLYTALFASAFLWIYGLYQNASEERDRALSEQSQFLAQAARQRTEKSDPEGAMLLALEGLKDSASDDPLQRKRPYVAAAEATLYDALYHQRRIATLPTQAAIAAAELSPDGKRLALATIDGNVDLWDTRTAQKLKQIGTGDPAIALVRFTSGGSRFLTVGQHARFWSSDGEPAGQLENFAGVVGGDAGAFVFSEDEAYLLGQMRAGQGEALEGQWHLWDARTGKDLAALSSAAYGSGKASFCPGAKAFVLKSEVGADRMFVTASRSEIGFGGADHVAITEGCKGALSQGSGNAVTVWSLHPGDTARAPTRIAESAADAEAYLNWQFSADGRLAAVPGTDAVTIWDLQERRRIRSFPAHGYTKVRFSPDNAFVAVFSESGGALWNVSDASRITSLPAIFSRAQAMFSPDSKYLVSAARRGDREIQMWRTELEGGPVSLKGHARGVMSVRFCGQSLVSQDADQILFWRLEGPSRPVAALNQPSEAEILCAPAGESIVTYRPSGSTAALWDIRTREARLLLAPANSGQDSARTVKQLENNTLALWDPAADRQIALLAGAVPTGAWGGYTEGLFTADGRVLATGSSDHNSIILWNAADGRQIAILALPSEASRLALSADGTRVAAATDGEVRLWDGNGHELARLPGDQEIALSRDGRRLLTRAVVDVDTAPAEAKLWDAGSGALIATLRPPNAAVRSIAFSSDGSLAVTGMGPATQEGGETPIDAQFWRSDDGAPKYRLRGHTGEILGAALDRSGRRAVTWSADHNARLWDVLSGTTLATFNRLERIPPPEDFHGGANATHFFMRLKIKALAFEPEKNRITLTFRGLEFPEGETLTWAVLDSTQALIDQAKRLAPRCLTPGERIEAGLAPEPSHWCIELGKWPYHTAEWKQWLAEVRAGRRAKAPEVAAE